MTQTRMIMENSLAPIPEPTHPTLMVVAGVISKRTRTHRRTATAIRASLHTREMGPMLGNLVPLEETPEEPATTLILRVTRQEMTADRGRLPQPLRKTETILATAIPIQGPPQAVQVNSNPLVPLGMTTLIPATGTVPMVKLTIALVGIKATTGQMRTPGHPSRPMRTIPADPKFLRTIDQMREDLTPTPEEQKQINRIEEIGKGMFPAYQKFLETYKTPSHPPRIRPHLRLITSTEPTDSPASAGTPRSGR